MYWGDVESVSEDGSLRSIAYYNNLIAGSAKCDNALWGSSENWSATVQELNNYCNQRAEYLKGVFSEWSVESDVPLAEYVDVDINDWYYNDVYAATRYGLMFGIGGDTFNPKANAQRSQVAQVIYRMEGAPAIVYKQIFSDVKQTEWYARAVSWAAEIVSLQGM